MSEKKRILFLTANPTETAQLGLEREAREVAEELYQAPLHDEFELTQQRVVSIQELRRAIFAAKPQIVHFPGHGAEEDIILEDNNGQTQMVSNEAISSFFRLFANQVECVVLNGCYSKAQAEAMGEHIKYVIGMRSEIGDKSSIHFAVGFYQSLGAGFSIEEAFESGKNAIQMQNIPEYSTPILHVRAIDKTVAANLQMPSIVENEPVEIFFSYSHRDEKLRQRLDIYLAGLRQQNVISDWSDRKILAGDEWAEEIDARLNSAQIILLLISPDFIASRYCYNIEMERAMERHEKGEARVVPVILSACDWQDLPFAKLQALPSGGSPITSSRNRNEAFNNVALGVKRLIEYMKSKN